MKKALAIRYVLNKNLEEAGEQALCMSVFQAWGKYQGCAAGYRSRRCGRAEEVEHKGDGGFVTGRIFWGTGSGQACELSPRPRPLACGALFVLHIHAPAGAQKSVCLGWDIRASLRMSASSAQERAHCGSLLPVLSHSDCKA